MVVHEAGRVVGYYGLAPTAVVPTGIPPWVIHDLRRTAKSLMARAEVPAHISERVLGHAIPGVEGIYDRHHYLEEKATALQSLARLINGIVTKLEPPEKIPPAPRRRIPTRKGDS